MENHENNVKLGDGIRDAAKTDINDRMTIIVRVLIKMVFDYLDQKVEKLPETVKQLRDNPKTTQEIIKMWSNDLYAQGLIPSGYTGLPDELLIHNFHQEGYLDGLFAGYALALTAMVDADVPKETILAVRDMLQPNLLGHSYEKRSEFIDLLKDEKYEWVSKENQNAIIDSMKRNVADACTDSDKTKFLTP